MTREIKFRAWIKESNTMRFEGFLLKPSQNSEEENGTLMQYTGLKDKNGKEIYEGDIVKGTKYGKEYITNVVWFYGFEGDSWPIAGYYLMFDEEYEFNDIPIMSRVEVIGNIYENPELLER